MNKIVIFDVDGVITDSVSTCYDAVCKIFNQANVSVPDLATYMREFDPCNPFDFYRTRGVKMSEKEIVRILNNHLISNPPQVFPQVRCVLAELKEQGFILAVASANSNSDMMIGVFEEAGISEFFGSGLERGFCLSDKGLYMNELCREYRCGHENATMVGDSHSDMVFAENAGIGCRIAFGMNEVLRPALLASPCTHFVVCHDHIVPTLNSRPDESGFKDRARQLFAPNSRIIVPK